jgi:predicted anti-sigma-YlaC factor YlaD
MNCARARFVLYAYLDREPPASDGKALERHLAFCGPCAARARSARSLANRLKGLRYDRAPVALLRRLSTGQYEPRVRHRYLSLGLAASILVLILPVVTDQAVSRGALFSMGAPVAVAAVSHAVVPVKRKMTGTFVCLQCEGNHAPNTCPAIEPEVHELGFCADDGETFRVMTSDANFASASVGEAVTVEGVAFPESGFLRTSRVGY